MAFIKPKKYNAKLIEVRQETPRVKVFRFVFPGINEFEFVPGQNIVASIPGFEDKDGPIKRAFSICQATKSYLELCIAQGKTFSAKMFELKIGDKIILEGPYGIFQLKKPVKQDTTFIAAGTGIAPLMSMIRTLIQENCKEQIWLFYGIRTPEDFIYKQELEEYAKLPNFNMIVSFSRSDAGLRGRITEHLKENIQTDREVYICGPQQMVNDTIKILKEIGIENINRERW